MDVPSPKAIVRSLLRVRFVRDVLTLQTGSFFYAGLGFLKSILFARLLGLHSFGQYAVVLAFTGVLEIFLNMGQSQAALIFFAEEYGKKNRRGMARVMHYFGVLSLFSALLLCAFFVSAHALAQWLYHDWNLGTFAQLEFFGAFVGMINPFFQIAIQTVREIKRLTILQNLEALLQLTFSSLFLILGFGISGIFLGVAASALCMLCVYLWTYSHLRTRYDLPTFRQAWHERGGELSYFIQGFWIAVDKNISSLYNQGTLMVLSLIAPPSIVGIAQLAFKLGTIPMAFFLPQISQMAMSTLPSVAAQGKATLRRTCAKLIKHTVAVHAALSFALLPAIPVIVLLFYGQQYANVIVPALWFTLIQIMSALAIVNTPLFRLFRKAYIPAIVRSGVFPLEIGSLLLFGYFVSPIAGFVASFFTAYLSNHILSLYLYHFLRSEPLPAPSHDSPILPPIP
jgi:O-antigen/teichoic acid export membrane protein